jgi:hypothetical protein
MTTYTNTNVSGNLGGIKIKITLKVFHEEDRKEKNI